MDWLGSITGIEARLLWVEVALNKPDLSAKGLLTNGGRGGREDFVGPREEENTKEGDTRDVKDDEFWRLESERVGE